MEAPEPVVEGVTNPVAVATGVLLAGASPDIPTVDFSASRIAPNPPLVLVASPALAPVERPVGAVEVLLLTLRWDVTNTSPDWQTYPSSVLQAPCQVSDLAKSI